MLTQLELFQEINYNPFTGLFIWLIQRGKSKFGNTAGYIDEKGYIRISIKGRTYRAHRLAYLWMTGEWPKNQIDHIDLVKSNNKWENIRPATNSENAMNKPKQQNNTSGHRGVHLHKHSGKWIASIKINQVRFYLGYFSDKKEAIEIYKNASRFWFSEFDNVNKVRNGFKVRN